MSHSPDEWSAALESRPTTTAPTTTEEPPGYWHKLTKEMPSYGYWLLCGFAAIVAIVILFVLWRIFSHLSVCKDGTKCEGALPECC